MRAIIATAILCFSTSPAAADRGLTHQQVQHYANAYMPGVRACYADNVHDARATGRLQIEGTVLAGGRLIGLVVKAPGVTGTDLAMLNACITKEAEDWHFPVARDATQIVIPYFFQKTAAPGTGPLYSCWNPHGCKKP